MSKGSQIILVDSAFFFALFYPKDSHHKEAIKKQDYLDESRIIVPWPILYETVNSKFVKFPETIRRFESIIRRSDTTLLDDSKYRDKAYEETLARAKRGYDARSLVDSVLHAILEDVNVRISAMLTFDHRDFVSICASQGVEII